MISFIPTLAFGITLLGQASAQIFEVTASLPGSPFDRQPINAAGQSFWIGGNPATYCPTQVNPYCPNVTGTILAAGFTALYVRLLSNPVRPASWLPMLIP